jgi:hypothetical protein
MLQAAEIEEGAGRWTSISAKEALKLPRNTFLRCPTCGERVAAYKASADGVSKDHFEHWPNSGGCAALPPRD